MLIASTSVSRLSLSTDCSTRSNVRYKFIPPPLFPFFTFFCSSNGIVATTFPKKLVKNPKHPRNWSKILDRSKFSPPLRTPWNEMEIEALERNVGIKSRYRRSELLRLIYAKPLSLTRRGIGLASVPFRWLGRALNLDIGPLLEAPPPLPLSRGIR